MLRHLRSFRYLRRRLAAVTISSALGLTQRMMQAAAAAQCVLDPGIMWRRTSGSGYPNGTVGSKPAMRGCTAGVSKTQLSSDVFLFNGWVWQRVAGTFHSYGTGNMQQKSVQYICNGSSSHQFKVITAGTVWFTNGSTGTSHRSTPEAGFACG